MRGIADVVPDLCKNLSVIKRVYKEYIMSTNKMYLKNLKNIGMVAVASMIVASPALATDQDVQAAIVTREEVALTLNNSMDFGRVDYTTAQTGTIVLSTAGAISVAGATGVTATGGTPAAGSVGVSGDATSTVDI